MAVTKYIKSDAPIQVRSNLIGVQVKVQKVSGINVILGFWVASCSMTGSGNAGKFATTATYGVTYFRYGATKTVDGVKYYNVQKCGTSVNSVIGPGHPRYLWKKGSSIFTRVGEQLYKYDNGQMVEYDTVGVLHNAQNPSTFIGVEVEYHSDWDYVTCLKSGDDSGDLYYLERMAGCIKDANGNVMGYVTSLSHLVDRSRDCVEYVETEEGGYWVSPDAMYKGPLWGPKDAKIGDTLDFCFKDNTYNPQTVNDVYYETVEPDCDVDFSVTGETWTSAGHFDKENNVIANAPVNIYLKFSQDVEVTEE